MKRHRSNVRNAAMIVTLVLAAAGTLWANGQEFFPAGNGPVDLVYFGRVKDARTGRRITEVPYVTITDRVTGLFLPFTGDSPGHFRSPDVGAQIRELTGEKVDPQQLEITVAVDGYKKLKLPKVPRRTKGTIELNVRLVPTTAAAATTGESQAAPGGPWNGTIGMVLLGCVALAAIAAVARTLGHPQSTRH